MADRLLGLRETLRIKFSNLSESGIPIAFRLPNAKKVHTTFSRVATAKVSVLHVVVVP